MKKRILGRGLAITLALAFSLAMLAVAIVALWEKKGVRWRGEF